MGRAGRPITSSQAPGLELVEVWKCLQEKNHRSRWWRLLHVSYMQKSLLHLVMASFVVQNALLRTQGLKS